MAVVRRAGQTALRDGVSLPHNTVSTVGDETLPMITPQANLRHDAHRGPSWVGAATIDHRCVCVATWRQRYACIPT